LYNITKIEELKGWMLSQQKSSLHDIHEWNEDGSWQGWKLGNIPPHLQQQAHLLIKSLKGNSPFIRTSRTTKDGVQ
jgi:hypothetical protein